MTEQLKKMTAEEFVKKVLAGERDFSCISLSGQNLNRYEGFWEMQDYLKRCHFSEDEANLGKNPIILTGSVLIGVYAHGLYLPYVKAEGADFTGSYFDNACFIRGDFEEAEFSHVSLKNAWLSDVLEVTSFNKASLHQANLAGACLKYAQLEDTDLGKADLDGANLDYAVLKQANLEKASLVSTSFREADLEGANLEEVNAARAYFRHTNLKGVNLRGANLSKATLRAADLTGANLFGARVMKADIERANFTGADLRDVVFNGSYAEQAEFSEADLSGTLVPMVNFAYARLRGAKNFDKCHGLDSANYFGTIVTPDQKIIIEVAMKSRELFFVKEVQSEKSKVEGSGTIVGSQDG